MRIARVALQAPPDAMAELARFYGDRLRLGAESAGGSLSVLVGGAALALTPAARASRPFHHFALLVAGDRFEAAHAWLGERASLLRRDDGGTVFDFDFWDARACYVHDPAGNIVELIAHGGIGVRRRAREPFSPAELLGISEVGLVSPSPATLIESLERERGLPLWFGDGSELGFVGRKAHTLVVAAEGRGWLPTGRPAERSPVEIVLDGSRDAVAELPEGRVAMIRRRRV